MGGKEGATEDGPDEMGASRVLGGVNVEGELFERVESMAADANGSLDQEDGPVGAAVVVTGVEGDVAPDERAVDIGFERQCADRVGVVVPEEADGAAGFGVAPELGDRPR